METKVKINNFYIGKTAQNEQTAQEHLDFVLNEVRKQFGQNRPLLVVNKKQLLVRSKYPTHFAAGWFWGEGINNPKHTSELVVVAHGDNFEDARKNLMSGMKDIYWNEDALDVDVAKQLPIDVILEKWSGIKTGEEINKELEELS